jgi:L-seryl-tRNA(Ser) seleniumtransferase
MTRLDPGAMNRLPDTAGLPDEFIITRSQRNMYDRAIRAAGGRLIEVGIADRFSGAGVRDAALWEVAEAIGPRTAALYHLAGPASLPALPQLARLAASHGVPLLVDAAAQLPPRENLRRFLAEGADLVCFSGGKALGGPQATGILAGRRDLVSAALAQMLDLDFPEGVFAAPAEFAPLNQLPGLPHHGIGRSCKIAKEQIVGLIVALNRFVAEPDEVRTARWTGRLHAVAAAAGCIPGVGLAVLADAAKPGLPLLELRFAPAAEAVRAEAALRAGDPAIHLDGSRAAQAVLAVNPLCLADADAPLLGRAIAACCA